MHDLRELLRDLRIVFPIAVQSPARIWGSPAPATSARLLLWKPSMNHRLAFSWNLIAATGWVAVFCAACGAPGGLVLQDDGAGGQAVASGGATGAGGTSTVAGGPNDGETCTLGSSNNCDPQCQQNCGSVDCVNICCTTTTRYGTWCGGKCVDMQEDRSNCGACGNTCSTGLCSEGECRINCDGPATEALGAVCESLCSQFGSDCTYALPMWPLPAGYGGASLTYKWTSVEQCKTDCLAGGNAPCSDALAELGNCRANDVTCSLGHAEFPICNSESNAAQACMNQCFID